MKKRFLSILLCVSMVMSLSAGMGIAAHATDTGNGNAVLTTPLDFTDKATQRAYATETDGITFVQTAYDQAETTDVNEAAYTLTLNGATINCTGNDKDDYIAFAIKLPDGTTVNTIGDTTVIAGDGYMSFGIYGAGTVDFEGTGELTAIGSTADYFSIGIYTYYNLINYGTVIGISGTGSYVDGIYAYGNLANGGTMTGIGGSAENNSTGVFVFKNLANNGIMTGTAGSAGKGSTGISAPLGSIINANKMTGTGGVAEVNNSVGIYAQNAISNEATAEMTGNGGQSGASSYGIYSEATITNCGTITANGGSPAYDSIGVISYGMNSLESGIINAKAGDGSNSGNGLNLLGDLNIAENSQVNAWGTTGISECYGLWTNANVTVRGTLNLYGGIMNGEGEKQAMYLERTDDAETAPILTITGSGLITADGVVKASAETGLSDAYDRCYTVTDGTPEMLNGTQSSVAPLSADTRMKIFHEAGSGLQDYSTCPRNTGCVYARFADADPTLWYHDGIHFCVQNGLMNGISGSAFSPNTPLSRAMLVTILYRLEGEPASSGSSAFSDVASGTWYEKAVAWANSQGLVEGYGDGTFGPNNSITREQLALILYRYAKYKGIDTAEAEDTNILSYDDAARVSTWAVTAMQWACGSRIINGIEGSLAPQGNATRAQAATMLQRFCEYVAG